MFDVPTFLETRQLGDGPAAVVLHGAPWDGSVSWRAGAADGPRGVRRASESIETFSLRLRRDCADVDIADAGDIDLSGLKPPEAIARIAEATGQRARAAAAVVTLGGDHSISIGTSRGLRAVHPDLAHVVYDAHLDIRASYDGSEYSHACGTRQMASAGPTCVLGVRSAAREEVADAGEMLVAWSEDLVLPAAMRTAIEKRPVLLSIDLDVLDPGTFSGTGNPEPGGASYRDLREALLDLAGTHVVGIDFAECAPGIDGSGVSAIVAAELTRECILGLLFRT